MPGSCILRCGPCASVCLGCAKNLQALSPKALLSGSKQAMRGATTVTRSMLGLVSNNLVNHDTLELEAEASTSWPDRPRRQPTRGPKTVPRGVERRFV